MTNEDTPHRRSDDTVTFREMVEYVADKEDRLMVARAESLVLINNAVEKMQAELSDHNKWHRDILQDSIAFLKNTQLQREAEGEQRTMENKQYRLGMYGFLLAIVALAVTSILTVTGH